MSSSTVHPPDASSATDSHAISAMQEEAAVKIAELVFAKSSPR